MEISSIVQRSEEHTSELQSRGHLVCRLLLEKKKETGTRDGRRPGAPRPPFPLLSLCAPWGPADFYTLSLHDALPICLADAVEVTVARHLAVLVALLVLVQQLERRAEAEAVHELDDGD